MLTRMLGLTLLQPLYETPGDGGGGGSTGDSGAGSSGAAVGGATAAPTVYEVSDDTLIKPKGAANPVKYGEHVKGLQSQFTKASQEAARLKREYDAYKAQVAQQQQAAQRQPQQSQQPDMLAQLEALPYLDGKQARAVVESIAQQIQQRDMVMMATLKNMQQMQGVLNNLNQSHTGQTFEAKIGKWMTDGNYPPEAARFAKALYLAHEGDDLDQEFPAIFKDYWDSLGKSFEGQRTAKLNAAKKVPFVPGRGGQAFPSKPLEIKANAKSRDMASELWNLMDHNEQT